MASQWKCSCPRLYVNLESTTYQPTTILISLSSLFDKVGILKHFDGTLMDYNSKKIHTVYSMELHNILDEIILIANKLIGENRGIELPLEKYKFFKDSH